MNGEAGFHEMIRHFARSAFALRALAAGELDAVVDPSTGSAVLLDAPSGRAQSALHESHRVARASLNLLAAHVCVLDSAGVVIMTNRAWRAFGAASEGAAADIPEGDNYLHACESERGEGRAEALAIAAGIRKVLAGEYELFRHESVRSTASGRRALAFTVTGFPGECAVSVVVSRGAAVGEARGRSAAPARVPVNELLAALPRDAVARLVSAGLEPAALRSGDLLFDAGRGAYVYFPVECAVSLLVPVPGHPGTEVALIGREGIVGPLQAAAEGGAILARVQAGGGAMRIRAAALARELSQSAPLERALARFSRALALQVMQTSACQRFHVVEQRLARMLLMTRDRTCCDEISLTQDLIADLLGVQRVAVSHAAGALQHAGVITYSRGSIRVIDHRRLRAAACTCYVPLPVA
jgi:CRP-like cAMP-binding protein